MELSREVDRAEGIRLGGAMQRLIEESVGAANVKLDPSVYRAEQPVYGPLIGAETMRYYGDPVEVDQVLKDAPPLEERPGRAERAAAIASCDPVVQALADRGMIKRDHGDGKLSIACPFENSHAEPGGETSTVYYLPNFGGVRYGKFNCKHFHCADRKQEDYIRALGADPRRVWREQAGHDDLPPLASYDEADQEGARWRTGRAKAPAGDEPRTGNGAAPAEFCGGAAPEASRVILARGDDLSVKAPRWLWDGWLARGKLHMLAGAPGTGKSTIGLELAAVVTTGGRWPDGTRCKLGNVLVWSDEDDPEDTLLPRFLAAGGDPRRIHFVTGTADRDGVRHFDPATDIPLLLAAARQIPECALVIVDPVVTAVTGDSHKNTEVRRALRPLVGFASDLGTVALGISHFTKGTQGAILSSGSQDPLRSERCPEWSWRPPGYGGDDDGAAADRALP